MTHDFLVQTSVFLFVVELLCDITSICFTLSLRFFFLITKILNYSFLRFLLMAFLTLHHFSLLQSFIGTPSTSRLPKKDHPEISLYCTVRLYSHYSGLSLKWFLIFISPFWRFKPHSILMKHKHKLDKWSHWSFRQFFF